jgi:hypothetical protein
MLDTVKRESIYQPEQPGLKFPEIPKFSTPAQERRHRQERLSPPVAPSRCTTWTTALPAT